MKKLTRMVGTFVAGTTLAVTAFGNAALADPADDLQIIVDNLPATVEAIPPALQAIVDTYNDTDSLNQAGFAAVQYGSGVVGTLVEGTEQFGALPLGFLFLAGAVHDFVRPYLIAIDDPDRADEILIADDIPIIIQNAPDIIDPLAENLTIAVIEGLQGNLTAGSGLFAGSGTPALLGNVVQGTVAATSELVKGTTFNTNYNQLPTYLGIAGLVVLSATAGYAQDAEDTLAPVFEALAPVTAPLVEALSG